MDKIKRFIDCFIPTETCNFRCHYCYINNYGKFNNKIFKLNHSVDEIKKALSVERLGGKCLINLCAGGETLLSPDVIPVAKALLEEGHYVMIVTNGSLTKRFEEICKFDERLLKHLFFKFSFHYLELKRLNLIDTFFNNIEMIKKSGISFTVEITPNDELEECIDEIKEISMQKLGALPHCTIARKDIKGIPVMSEHSLEEYVKIWSQFDSKLLNFKDSLFNVKREEFCYAGLWTCYLNLETGELRQCYKGLTFDNIYKNIDKPIKFRPIGCNCKEDHCYNGHVWLALGDIPEIKAPYYDELRNRKCEDGTEWLSPEMKSFMHTKLEESNQQLTKEEKKKVNREFKKDNLKLIIKNKYKRIKEKIHEKK